MTDFEVYIGPTFGPLEDLARGLLGEIAAIHSEVFSEAPWRASHKVFRDLCHTAAAAPILVAQAARVEGRVVGFKLGGGFLHDQSLDDRFSAGHFYSFRGGVLPAYRRRGIASRLIDDQHRIATWLGFHAVESDSWNPSMIVINETAGMKPEAVPEWWWCHESRTAAKGRPWMRFRKPLAGCAGCP